MKPYYEQDGITIYNADCRDVLPTLDPVDLVLTDPPYGGVLFGFGKGWLEQSVKKHGGGNWDFRPTGELLRQVIAMGQVAIVWGGNYFASDLPDGRGWLVWDKDNGRDSFADCELAWTSLDAAVRKFTRHRQTGPTRSHPTQKPVSLFQWCIQQAPDDVSTVLDPFMGSGTTLRAAKDLGRNAIGIEIEERYCEISANRLAQGVLL